MSDTLSIQEARKLALLSQKLPPGKSVCSAVSATLSTIEHLGYIQIDTLSVIQRAHHHTLWNRNPRYQASQLDQLVEEKQVFEYWSHAAAYLPMRDFRFSLPRKHALASGEREHWFDRDKEMEQMVLRRISDEGPLMAKDFDGKGKGVWKTKPAKRALENLFMQGDLMISRRNNFHKVYDLTERVLPEGVNTTLPTPQEHARFLVTRYLTANGLGLPSEIGYLLPGMRKQVTETLKDMVVNREVLEVLVEDQKYFVLPEAFELLSKPLARSKLKILSPFDNLVIQRKRIKAFFGFDYQIECYLPAAKRQYGYFTLPILWNGNLVARMDCKADRKESLLHIHNLVLEPGLVKVDSFLDAFMQELESFLVFNGCSDVCVHKTSPATLKTELERLIG